MVPPTKDHSLMNLLGEVEDILSAFIVTAQLLLALLSISRT